MDFKVCGTRKGVTGFQLDLKIQGLPFDIAKEAVVQVTAARMKILDVMDAALPSHRTELREHAPRIETVKIDPEKIGALIGPGGKNIRRITEVTGANIDIDEDNSGKVRIYATNSEAMKRALEEVDLVTGEIEVGKIYRGIVRGVKEFGAFVECYQARKDFATFLNSLTSVSIKPRIFANLEMKLSSSASGSTTKDALN